MFIKLIETVMHVIPSKRYEEVLDKLPLGCRMAAEKDDEIDTIVCFLGSRTVMEIELSVLKNRLKKTGKLWKVYPKGSSRVRTDIHRDSIDAYGQSIGLKGVAIISIDETWSGLRMKRMD